MFREPWPLRGRSRGERPGNAGAHVSAETSGSAHRGCRPTQRVVRRMGASQRSVVRTAVRASGLRCRWRPTGGAAWRTVERTAAEVAHRGGSEWRRGAWSAAAGDTRASKASRAEPRAFRGGLVPELAGCVLRATRVVSPSPGPPCHVFEDPRPARDSQRVSLEREFLVGGARARLAGLRSTGSSRQSSWAVFGNAPLGAHFWTMFPVRLAGPACQRRADGS
jgi:hypothetical protein